MSTITKKKENKLHHQFINDEGDEVIDVDIQQVERDQREESEAATSTELKAGPLVQNRVIRALYGDITVREFKKFGLLSLTFFMIIGSYWLLRPLKDGVFFTIVGGKEFQPYAKMGSVFVVTAVVLIYSKLVDMYSRVHLIYLVTVVFGCTLIGVALILQHPTIGLANTNASPDRLIGWFVYFAIECYGSLMVSMFWSFVNSITMGASARKGYPIIVGGAQTGAIAGPFLAVKAESLGVGPLFFVAGIATFGVAALVRYFVTTLPDQVEGGKDDDKKPKTGFFEGLKIIASRPYVLGIMLVSTLYEVVATITDYQMKILAHDTPDYSSAEGLTSFLGLYGMTTNTVALVVSVLGTSYFMRQFGLRFCLLAYPASVAITSVALYWFSDLEISQLLWLTFVVMVLTKGLSYSLNNPAKEMMYIPTSKDVKFKAKGWIDLFGGRAAKASGSVVTNVLKTIPTAGGMMRSGALVSLAIVSVWTFAANRVGTKFKKLTESDQTIE